jgi:hypothetical protein
MTKAGSNAKNNAMLFPPIYLSFNPMLLNKSGHQG